MTKYVKFQSQQSDKQNNNNRWQVSFNSVIAAVGSRGSCLKLQPRLSRLSKRLRLSSSPPQSPAACDPRRSPSASFQRHVFRIGPSLSLPLVHNRFKLLNSSLVYRLLVTNVWATYGKGYARHKLSCGGVFSFFLRWVRNMRRNCWY